MQTRLGCRNDMARTGKQPAGPVTSWRRAACDRAGGRPQRRMYGPAYGERTYWRCPEGHALLIFVTLTLSLRVYINYHERTRRRAESAASAVAVYSSATNRGVGLGEINHTIPPFLHSSDSSESPKRARGAPRETVVAIARLAARENGRP